MWFWIIVIVVVIVFCSKKGGSKNQNNTSQARQNNSVGSKSTVSSVQRNAVSPTTAQIDNFDFNQILTLVLKTASMLNRGGVDDVKVGVSVNDCNKYHISIWTDGKFWAQLEKALCVGGMEKDNISWLQKNFDDDCDFSYSGEYKETVSVGEIGASISKSRYTYKRINISKEGNSFIVVF